MADFSSKQKAIAIAPKFTSLLSMMGSGYIMWDVLIHTQKVRNSTQHRILLGMSTCDFIVSTTFFFGTWPIPVEHSEDVYGASGNQATCTAQGFFSQFSLAVAMYNAALTVFYVSKIRWNWTPQRITRRLEPWLHVIPLCIGLGTATAGIFLKLYNNDSWECWIAPKPHGCKESYENGGITTCIRGDNASLYRWVFYYAILWLAIILVTVNMFLVYFSVLAKEKAMDRYTFGLDTAAPVTVRSETKQQGSNNNKDDAATEEAHSGSTNQTAATTATGTTTEQQSQQQQPKSSQKRVSFKTRVLTRIPTFGGGGGSSTMESRTCDGTNPDRRRQQQQRRQRKHSKRVANQGYWYCGAFYSTWFFPTITRLVQVIPPGRTPFPLILITAMMVPIQGFFNFLVYSHPQFAKWRKNRGGGGGGRASTTSSRYNARSGAGSSTINNPSRGGISRAYQHARDSVSSAGQYVSSSLRSHVPSQHSQHHDDNDHDNNNHDHDHHATSIAAEEANKNVSQVPPSEVEAE